MEEQSAALQAQESKCRSLALQLDEVRAQLRDTMAAKEQSTAEVEAQRRHCALLQAQLDELAESASFDKARGERLQGVVADLTAHLRATSQDLQRSNEATAALEASLAAAREEVWSLRARAPPHEYMQRLAKTAGSRHTRRRLFPAAADRRDSSVLDRPAEGCADSEDIDLERPQPAESLAAPQPAAVCRSASKPLRTKTVGSPVAMMELSSGVSSAKLDEHPLALRSPGPVIPTYKQNISCDDEDPVPCVLFHCQPSRLLQQHG